MNTKYACVGLMGILAGCGAAKDTPSQEDVEVVSSAITTVAALADGDYVFKSVNSGKCLDVASASTADGAAVQQYDCNGTDAQRFRVSSVGGGYVSIVNAKSNKALDVVKASTADGALLQQWTYGGGENQQFQIFDAGNGQLGIRARHSGKTLDVKDVSQQNGARVQQWTWYGSGNQRWTTGQGPSNCLNTGDGNTTLRFINRCSFPVNFAGNNIASGRLSSGGEECRTIGTNTDHMISKRYWGFREGNDPGNEHRSLAEFGFNEVFQGRTSWDWFNLSFVDANNLPLKIVPYEVGGGNTCANQTRSCPMDMLRNCPEVGKLRNGAGEVIACVSHDRDNGNSPVAKYFDAMCNQSYSWSKDDSVMAACNAGDFDIVFCP